MPEPTTALVYVPTLITSVEQAEKLPELTELIHRDSRCRSSVWWINQTTKGPRLINAKTAILVSAALERWTGDLEALVPVTATVETTGEYHHPADGLGWHTLTRYTTPWTPEEEA